MQRYGGDSTLFNDYMSLTPAAPNKVGWTWTVAATVLSSWEVEFDFHVGGAPNRGSGGGLAFWWTAQPGKPGTIYGQSDNFKGLGIFFDTYEAEPRPANEAGETAIAAGNAEPYIVAMVNDGTPLAGGDPSRLPDSTLLASKQVAVCFAHYRNLQHIARARVTWNHGQLKLWLDLERSKVFQPCLETQISDARLAAMPSEGYFGLSASTGAYGDAHVIYSMTTAQLDPVKDEVIATPHVAQPGEAALDESHVVHADAPTDHETHVKLVPTELPPEVAAHGDGGGAHGEAGPEHPMPVHVAPSAEHDEQLEHVLAAMEHQTELRDAVQGLREELSQLSLTHAEKARELLDSVHGLKAESKQVLAQLSSTQQHASGGVSHHAAPAALPAAAAVPAAGVAVPPAGTATATLPPDVLKKVDELTHGMAEAKMMVHKLAEGEGAHHNKREVAEKSHQHSLDQISSRLDAMKALEHEMSSVVSTLGGVKRDMDALRDTSRAMVAEVRADTAALKQVVEELHANSSRSSMLFPLCVCAQALVVAAGLFYSMFAGGAKKSKGYLD